MLLMPANILNGQICPYFRKRNHVRISTYHFDYVVDLQIPVKISENASADSGKRLSLMDWIEVPMTGRSGNSTNTT